MSEIVQVPFHGTFLHTTLDEDGHPAVIIKPTIQGMGLDWSAQLKKLKTRSWATVAETATVGADGKSRDMATVDLDTWSMLLANIDENKVKESAKDLVVAYQKESAKALRDYWTNGAAINRRLAAPEPVVALPELEPFKPKTFPLAEVVVLIKQQFGVRISIADLKEKLRQAGAVRQDDRPHAKYERLFWHTGESGKAYEVFGHQIEAVYRIYEATKIRLEMQAQRSLPLDPPGWPELPLGGEA